MFDRVKQKLREKAAEQVRKQGPRIAEKVRDRLSGGAGAGYGSRRRDDDDGYTGYTDTGYPGGDDNRGPDTNGAPDTGGPDSSGPDTSPGGDTSDSSTE